MHMNSVGYSATAKDSASLCQGGILWQSSRRASNLKYLPPAFLSTPIFGEISCLLRGSLKPFDLLSQNSAKSIKTYSPSSPETYLTPIAWICHTHITTTTRLAKRFRSHTTSASTILDSSSLLRRLPRGFVSSSRSLGSMEESRILHALINVSI